MSKTLLLADDSVVIQKLVGLSFANEDVEILSTDNGDDAIIRAREVVPDVVLADVVMPGKSGYEVCAAIKQDPALAHIPVLLLTGTFEAFDEAKAEASGANGQITKPFEAQALVSRVTEVMNQSAAVTTPAAPEDPIQPAEFSAPSAMESDFFDVNATPLAAPAAAAPVSPAEPAPGPLSASSTFSQTAEDFILDEPGESRSTLFGRPGDAMASDFEARPNSTVADSAWPATTSDSRQTDPSPADATPAMLDPLTPPALPTTDTTVVVEANVAGDPLEGLSDDFGLNTARNPSLPASAVDVDSALASGQEADNATILVAENDANAKTSSNEIIPPGQAGTKPLAQISLAPRALETDPNARIDLNPELQSVPVLPPSHDSRLDPTEGTAQKSVSAIEVTDLDERLAESDVLADPSSNPPADDLLDLGPTSLAAADLDFAFDVSEQQPISDFEDPLGQSYSSLMDISDSQILSDPTADSESIANDYDVSSSEVEAAAAIPPATPPAFYETARPTTLPPAHDSSRWSTGDARSATPEIPGADPDTHSISGSDQESVVVAAVEDSYSAAPMNHDEIGPSDPMPTPTPIEIEESTNAVEELIVGEGLRTAESGSQSTPDLSPMMEQRIQETLEKVAWEAFSDLSESIVNQVMNRVEQIAWEVIPQMAETLVREEIRRMKGDDD